jgi:hypothetical protein
MTGTDNTKGGSLGSKVQCVARSFPAPPGTHPHAAACSRA